MTDNREMNKAVLDREREFHDRLAERLSPETMPPRQPDHLEQALLNILGDISQLNVLDLGCGTGDLSLALLQKGAAVTGLDLSPGMVEVARRRAELHAPGAAAQFIAAPVEESGLPAGEFDVVCGKWILHHIDLNSGTLEILRLMSTPARAAFIENTSYNPLLDWARRHVAGRFGIPRVGTADEHPLSRSDVAAIGSVAGGVRVINPDFHFFRLFERQVFRHKYQPVMRVLGGWDDRLYRSVPRLRQYSYHAILWLDKA